MSYLYIDRLYSSLCDTVVSIIIPIYFSLFLGFAVFEIIQNSERRSVAGQLREVKPQLAPLIAGSSLKFQEDQIYVILS